MKQCLARHVFHSAAHDLRRGNSSRPEFLFLELKRNAKTLGECCQHLLQRRLHPEGEGFCWCGERPLFLWLAGPIPGGRSRGACAGPRGLPGPAGVALGRGSQRHNAQLWSACGGGRCRPIEPKIVVSQEQIEPVGERLPSAVLGLHLERDGQELRLYDPVLGTRLLTSREQRDVERREAEAGGLA